MTSILLLLMVATGTPELCGVCHPDTRVLFAQSIHSNEELTCTSCHGGNPKADTVEGAHRGSFKGKIRRREIPALCASCHSDGNLMRPYNLPTDQYALYQTSPHGRTLASGDDRAALCTDCHGVHGILEVEDPKSPVHSRNAPATCAQCHSKPAMMKAFGWETDPYALFMAGKHGEALLKRQDASAPGCARCHGSHGAAPPGVGDVNKVCGQCHTAVRDRYLESPHREGLTAAGLPECSSCHGHHDIRRAEMKDLDKVCVTCHDTGSAEADLGVKMQTLYAAAEADVEKGAGVIEEAKGVPLHVEDYEARLEEARTDLIEAETAMHSLDLAQIERLTGRARSIGNEVASEAHEKIEALTWRKVGLLVFWFYLIVTIMVLVRFRARAVRESAGSGA
jgi:predicted CXXCH cytochrome family protein